MAGRVQYYAIDSMSTTLSDEQVVERIRSGDRESYGLLASRYHQRLHRLARRFARDPSDAEDALQGAHLLALKHFDQYEGRSGYVEWMASITKNAVRTLYRRNRISDGHEKLLDCYPEPALSPEQLAIGRDIQRVVARALDRIPPAYSMVFRMCELGDMSIAETGRRLALTDACVKSRMHRARSMLRRAIGSQLCGQEFRQPSRRHVALPASRGGNILADRLRSPQMVT